MPQTVFLSTYVTSFTQACSTNRALLILADMIINSVLTNSDPENGLVSCSDGNDHGSTCTFTCLVGYELQGQRTLTCRDSGSHIPKQNWDFERPWCKG